MNSQDVEVDALLLDLSDDRIAFTPAAPVDGGLAQQLSARLAEPGDVIGEAAFVVAGPGAGTDLRDMGQAVLDAEGGTLDTVIVRGPDAVAVVSETASRAAIESSQNELLAHPDYIVGLESFLTAINGRSIGSGDWLLVTAAALIAFALVAALTFASARKVK